MEEEEEEEEAMEEEKDEEEEEEVVEEEKEEEDEKEEEEEMEKGEQMLGMYSTPLVICAAFTLCYKEPRERVWKIVCPLYTNIPFHIWI